MLKFEKKSVTKRLKKPDSITTKDLAETTRYMIQTFTPEDKEKTDGAYHKLIRAATEVPITKEDEIPFT